MKGLISVKDIKFFKTHSKSNTNFLSIVIFYMIVVNTTYLGLSFSRLAKIGEFTCMILMAIFVFKRFFNSDIQYKDIFGILILTILILINFFLDNTYLCLMLFFSIYCFNFTLYEIVISYAKGAFGSILLVLPLSLLGFLPTRTSNNILSFGFVNPNILGFFLTNIVISFFLYKKDNWKLVKYILCVLVVTFDYFFLKDQSATFLTLLFIILSVILHNKIIFHAFRMILVTFPVLITFLSLFLTIDVYKYNWCLNLSRLLTYRPEIWNAYYNVYQLKWLPQQFQPFQLNQFGSSFYGSNVPFIYQGFDGSYIYNLITQGIFVSVMIIVILTYLVIKANLHGSYLILSYICILLIFAFTESMVASPFGYFESPLLIIAVNSCFNKNMWKVEKNDS